MIKKINSLLAATSRKITGEIPEENKVKINALHSPEELNSLLTTDYSQAFENFQQKKCIFRGVTPQVSRKLFYIKKVERLY